MEQVFSLHFPQAEYILTPMADGGEGTLRCLMSSLEGKLYSAIVSDPEEKTVAASYGILNENNELLNNEKTAIIEMAEASGFHLIKHEKREPLKYNTIGTGQLILAALDQGCRRFLITLGGSATCDGGMGALHALGIKFKNGSLECLHPSGEALSHIVEIDSQQLDPRLKECEFILISDVDNPLLGLEGALMYAPQKGATASDIEILHKGYEQWAYILQKETGKNVATIPGSGAAGGLGAGLYAFLNAKFEPGAEYVMKMIDLPSKLEEASLVVTGEGQIDVQTIHGKTPLAIAKLAKMRGVPVIAIAGGLKEGFESVYSEGIDAVFTLPWGPMSKEECIRLVKPLMINCINNIASTLKLRIV